MVTFTAVKMNWVSLSVLVLLVPLINSSPMKTDEEIKCTYENCPAIDPKKINVHIISHTHDDVGWLKTVDQYYYGSRNNIQNAGVQYILDSVIDALVKDPSRRFIYVESAFFFRWWREQTDATRHVVRKLVQEGRLEFIGGGWSMNDEGAAHYNAIIDNMSLGLLLLNDTFGKCGRPKVAWQIDPFGHSREQASIFAQMGYDGLFFGRLDYRDKNTRMNTHTMEVVWQGSANLGSKADLFTGVLPNLYQPPSGFCFDILCTDSPIMDDHRMEDYNVEKKVMQFMKHVNRQSKWYRTNNIVMTMGNDFNYQNAHTWFKNLDKLIYHVNKMQPNVSVFYSTPSCYLNSLHKSNLSWKVKEQDFMPYASEPHAYWSGYFTSRPTFKRYIRYSNNFLQVCKQLDAIAGLGPMDQGDTTVLKHAMAVVQHHDAVTGTAKQHVTDDYYKRLYKGTESCQLVVSDAYKKLMVGIKTKSPPPPQYFCNLLNITECAFTERNAKFTMTVYNPIGRPVAKYLRVPVSSGDYIVKTSDGITIETQVVPVPEEVKTIAGRKSLADAELVFKAKLPALGYSTFSVERKKDNPMEELKEIKLDGSDFSIENSILKLTFDGKTGLLKSMSNAQDGSKVDMKQSFYWYYGMNGDNRQVSTRASGAYIFRPNGTHPYIIADSTISVKIVKGAIVQEVHQAYSPWVSQVIRVYKDENNAEFEWLVGPIPVGDRIGKEIISRFDTNIESLNEFYTDSNGREMLKRVRDKRPDYVLSSSNEPVAVNYYPVNSRIYLKDNSTQLTVSTDRSHSGASLYSGSLEIMLHRRLLHDDGFGVGEPLDEMAFGTGLVSRGINYVQLSKLQNAAALHRELGERIFMAPWLSFSSSKLSESNLKLEFSGLKQPLPANVHLLTLEQWTAGSILVRLEHFYEKNEDPGKMSKPATVSLKNMFTAFNVLDATEMSLDGVHQLSEMKRLKWKTYNAPSSNSKDSPRHLDIDNITLNPMEIRTFVLKVSKH